MAFPTFQKYEIEGILGEGSMGAVYKARHRMLGRTVALKVPHVEMMRNTISKERFLREGRALAMLQHPNVVGIYDADEENNIPFIAMEFVEGVTLTRLIRDNKRLSFSETKDIALQIASALDYIHSKGILHRDLKSSNVLITPKGEARITDFGIAMLNVQTTITNGILGTPAYMSPEQARGDTLDERSDLYSLGVIMYEALTGRPPLLAENGLALIQQIINQSPPPLETYRPDVPEELSRIVHRCLEKKPKARFSSGAQLVLALQKKAPPSSHRPISGSEKGAAMHQLIARFSTLFTTLHLKTATYGTPILRDRPAMIAIALVALCLLGLSLIVTSIGQRKDSSVSSDSTSIEAVAPDSTSNSNWTPWPQ